MSREIRTLSLLCHIAVGHANRLAVEVPCESSKSKGEPSRVSERGVVLQSRDSGLSPRSSHRLLNCVSSPFSISIAVSTLHNHCVRGGGLLLMTFGTHLTKLETDVTIVVVTKDECCKKDCCSCNPLNKVHLRNILELTTRNGGCL